MSMYNHILEAALRERSHHKTGITEGEALAVLFECRKRLGPIESSERGLDWSSTALANQLAYDLALLDLAGCVGIDCDPTSFDQPQRRRIEIEQELAELGVRLDELDHQPSSSSEPR